MPKLIKLINDDVLKVMTPLGREPQWHEDLERFIKNGKEIREKDLGEAVVEALQRLLNFLGYATSRRGKFKVDGDFGRGTHRGIAQFQFDYKLKGALSLDTLAYDCSWQNAHLKLLDFPELKLNRSTVYALVQVVRKNIEQQHLLCGDFSTALKQLNRSQTRSYYSCREIQYHYGDFAEDAVQRVATQSGRVHPRWILAIIKQETGGVIRPRFKQYLFSRLVKQYPNTDAATLRFSAMDSGLGQIPGTDFSKAGASNPEALVCSPLAEQVYFVARYLSHHSSAATDEPSDDDFHAIAQYYNGPEYKKHDYHASLKRRYHEFKVLG